MSQESKVTRSEIHKRGLFSLCHQLDISIDKIIVAYSGRYFSESDIEKADFFKGVLHNSLNNAQTLFLEKRCSLSFHKDNREVVEYGKDLAIGWLAEDAVLHKLSDFGLKIRSTGSDSHREYLAKQNIGTHSDYIVTSQNRAIAVELVISWNNYWIKTNRLDLRDSKFKRLSNKNIESVLIGIEPNSSCFFITSVEKIKNEFQWRENPAWGNKGVYTLNSIDKLMKPMTLFENEYLQNFFR